MEQTPSKDSPTVKTRSGIRRRFAWAMTFLVISVSVLLTLFQISSYTSILEAELGKRVVLKQENLQRRALALVDQVKRRTEDELASYNLSYLATELIQLVRNQPDLVLIVLANKADTVVLHTADPDLQQKPLILTESDSRQFIAADHFLLNESPDEIITNTRIREQTQWLDYRVPIYSGANEWGYLVMRFSLQDLNDEIKLSQHDISESIHAMTLKTLLIVVCVLLVAYLVISQLSRRLSAPLIQLTQYAKQIADGDFSLGQRISKVKDDEVGLLTESFVEMARRLEQSYAELAGYNERLEQEVEERTRELSDSQQQLIYSEKMAALGILIASIAHEINTPMGAIQASAENAEKGFKHFIRDLEMLMNVRDEDKAFFILLLQNSQVLTGITTREERKMRRTVEASLSENDVPMAEEMALLLVEMGLHADLPKLMPYLTTRDALNLVRSAHQLFSVQEGLVTINSATARVSKIVFALKHFTHRESSGEKVLANLNQGLETVLELYRGLFKQGCEVVRNFEALPDLLCYPDELNQVWTNLIHNALQAMNNKGVIELATYVERIGEQAAIVVTVTDNGPGIPDELKNKVWESFFTTKAAGEGSGMGLGICRRIVERHQGQLTFESEPGRTVFKVQLPLL